MTYDGTDTYTLSTGRAFYANNGILGLTPGDGTLHEGYDGTVSESVARDWDREHNPFTREERVEIARFMIQQWEDWIGR